MSNANWRGIVGVVKPTYKSGSLVDFIRLLPDGVGVVPLFIGAQEHTEDEYFRAMDIYHQRIAELARIGVDLIHPEGGPPSWFVDMKLNVSLSKLGKDLNVPIIHPVAAGVWSVLKHLHVTQHLKSFSRLLE